MLSSFYLGYLLGQIPSLLLIFRFGSKYCLATSIVMSSLVTIVTPVSCHYSFEWCIGFRVLLGIVASPTFPSIMFLFPEWIPHNESTSLIAFVWSGSFVVIYTNINIYFCFSLIAPFIMAGRYPHLHGVGIPR